MNAHLNNDELTDYLLGTPQVGTEAHLGTCAECRAEADKVARSIGSFKAWTHAQAVAREPKLNVFAFAALKENRLFVSWFSWSASLALFVVALVLMAMPRQRETPPVAAQSTVQPDAGDVLLVQVQQDLENNVPRALAPAEMLTAERNRMIRETRQARN
jgi:predicted anti-sigma-YlaC factor YlaD